MSGVSIEKVSDDEDGMRLDRWFKEHIPYLPFGRLQKLLRTGQIRVDGGRVKAETRLEAGQKVRIPPISENPSPSSSHQNHYDDEDDDDEIAIKSGGQYKNPGISRAGFERDDEYRGSDASANRRNDNYAKNDRALNEDAKFIKSITIYEDRDILVINKPYGLAVQGGSGTTRHVDGMLEALRDRDGVKPRLVHRLDKDTAGCLILAKSRIAAATLARTFRSRSARKVYWALVPGVPKEKQGRVSSWLAKGEDEWGDQKMRVAKHGEQGADHSLTYYALVETAAQKFSWLSLKPVTGRTHQLRVHMAEIGHPIIGDPKYFNRDNWELPGGFQNRLHLLARRIVIPHPRNGEMMDFTAPLPQHMQQSWNLLGFDVKQYDPIEEAPEK